ncbi:predicted protein [Sparassis crispa]|uniref:Pentatricopeptide repeat-containing protein n=1 Tax=Sparassis crispa TaxID=139825 RepID=A0A401G6S1_9APHY|nr:predicted protein [Sparassis crispa]GBE77871.1 predicted protein [Sparassis crispa]
MLLRNACHKIASPVSLDFLVPGLIFTRNASKKAPVKLQIHNGSNKPNVPHIPTASTSSNYSPATILNKLDLQIQAFHDQLVGAPTDSQVALFNRVIPELRHALETSNITKAWRFWTTLKAKNLLAFFGPSHHDVYSRYVAAVCDARSPDLPWSRVEAEALEEIAVVAASGGAIEGLKAYMLSYVKLGDANAVLHSYQLYLSLLQENDPRQQVDDIKEDVKDEDESSTDVTIQSPVYTLVQGDILLLAVTAHIIQNSYDEALQAALQVRARIHLSSYEELLRHLGHDHPLRDKLTLYVPHLNAARLVARPGAFSRQIANLTRDFADKALEKFYRSIIEGMSGPNPCLTANASEKNIHGLVVMPDFAWASFITGFLRCRRIDLTEKLWDDMIRLGIRPSIVTWNALIDGYAELRVVDMAVDTWNVMLAQGFKPDAMTHRALIHALFYAGQPDEAMKRLRAFKESLPKLSPRPEESTVLVVYNTVLHGLLFNQREIEARNLLQQLQTEGPKPDIVTFNTILRYYGKQGDLKQLADVLEMIEPAGIVGDVFTFSIVLSALLKVRDDAPQIVISLMKKQGVEPNAATISAIIDHQMRAQTESSFRGALELLSKMEQSELPDMQPNEVTYTSILTGNAYWKRCRLVAYNQTR